jgi:hypothetical protein
MAGNRSGGELFRISAGDRATAGHLICPDGLSPWPGSSRYSLRAKAESSRRIKLICPTCPAPFAKIFLFFRN